MKRFTLILSLLIISVTLTFAQKQVTGVIADESGEPLIGASVIAEGTTLGTITDLDGSFDLNVPNDVTSLVVSYTGFNSQILDITSQTNFDVVLSEGILLEEAIVTAVGIERSRKSVGFAVTSLDKSDVQQISEPDPIRTLQGKIPGVSIVGGGGAVGGGTNITVRGNSSLLGNNQPLFVVDGIPFDNTAFESGSFTAATTATSRSFDLDPNTIESINVLRGAAAAVLYGTRGSNGVIVVTTKANRINNPKKLEVSVNSSYSVEQISNLPDLQTRYANGNNFLLVNGNFGTWGASFDTNEPEWLVASNSGQLTDASGGAFSGGQAHILHPYNNTGTGRAALSDKFVPFQATNNADDFFQTGSAVENAVSISGGNEKANFVAGFSRLDNVGIVPNNEVERTGVNFGGNAQLSNGLYLQGAVNFVRTDLTGPPTSGLFTGNASVTERILYLPPSLDLANSPIENEVGDQLFYRTDNDNPYYLAEYSRNTQITDRVYGRLKLTADLTNWLSVAYSGGFNTYNIGATNVLPRSTRELPQGQIVIDDIRFEELDGTLLFTLTRPLTKSIGLSANIGHNVNQRTINRQSSLGQGIIVRRIFDLDNTASVIPNGGDFERRRQHSVLADFTFDYNNWAFLNLGIRNEWNSGLPTTDQSFISGGGSLALDLTEAFDVKSDILDFAKVRLGYAVVGNDIDPYLTRTTFSTNAGLGNNISRIDFPISNVNVVSQSAELGNSALQAERTKEYEFGVDLSLLKGKIDFEASYYNRSSQDQIVPISVAASSGFTTRVVNIGEVENKGYELALGLTPIRTKDFYFKNRFIFSKNDNTVIDLGDVDEIFIAGFGNSVQSVHKVGQPFGLIQGSTAARSASGKLLVDQSTGKLITNLAPEVIADPNPDFSASYSPSIGYKGFRVSALVDWRKGGEVWSATFNQLFGRGVTEQTVPNHPDGRRITLVIPGVEADPNNLFQAALDEDGNEKVNGTQVTVNDWWFINTFGSAGPDEFAVFDASTIRLREVSLSYTAPKSLMENTPFGQATISITGRNLWFQAYNMPGSLNFDPESSSLGAGNVNSLAGGGATNGSSQGVDFGIIPTTKRFGVNLSFTF